MGAPSVARTLAESLIGGPHPRSVCPGAITNDCRPAIATYSHGRLLVPVHKHCFIALFIPGRVPSISPAQQSSIPLVTSLCATQRQIAPPEISIWLRQGPTGFVHLSQITGHEMSQFGCWKCMRHACKSQPAQSRSFHNSHSQIHIFRHSR